MRNLHLGLYTPNQGVPKHSGSLFHSTRAVPEKKKILEEEFGVAMNEELEREVLVMCNLSQGVKAEGISIGEMRMLVKQVRKGRVTIEEAAEDAGMTVEEFKKILENTPLQAVYLIKKLLSDGDMRAREIYMRMKDEGISRRTAENTKKELGIRSYRKMRQWYWSIHTGE